MPSHERPPGEVSWSGEGMGTDRASFLAKVNARLMGEEPAEASEAVFCTLSQHLSGAVVGMIRAALPQMMAQRSGRIVTIASILGKVGGFGYVSAYTASKHGVVGLTRALAAELGSQGYPAITVNAVCPGYTRAGMGIAIQSTKAGPRSGEEIFDRYYKRQVAQRRMMEPEEIAHVAVFLASPDAAGITGQALNVDGGFVTS